MTLWNSLRDKCLQQSDTVSLGEYSSSALRTDPKHLLFSLSRYKAAAKMLPLEKGATLEMGCGDGLGALILKQFSSSVLAVDGDSRAIQSAEAMNIPDITFLCDDFLGKKYGRFAAVVSLDVIEHIHSHLEDRFFSAISDNLDDDGVCIIGTPNSTAEQYTYDSNLESHVNLYNAERLYATLKTRFHNVFLFGMNDEVLHTGFYPMCHYLIAAACNKK